jgi:probable rRNA maturation factor
MRLKIEINNLAKSPIEKKLPKRIAKLAIEKSGYVFLHNKTIALSFAWVDEIEIKKINYAYRRKNKATNVLSFCEYEKLAELKNNSEKEIFLGEIILCYDYIEALAKKHSVSEIGALERELAKIIAHGVLHLLCFRHGKKMFAIQDACSE